MRVRYIIPTIVLYSLAPVLVLLFANSVKYSIQTERKIATRGKRANSWRTYTPFNIGLLFTAFWYFSKHRNHELWQSLFRDVGSTSNPYNVEAITFNRRTILTADEENVKAILATQFQDFGKGPDFRRVWEEFLGLSMCSEGLTEYAKLMYIAGIFATDSEMWHKSRQLLRPQFNKDRISDLHTFEKHSRIMLPLLAGTEPGDGVRIDELFHRLALDVATDFLLGTSVGSLVDGQTEFAEAFAEVQHMQAVIMRSGPFEPLLSRKSYRRSLGVLNRFIDRYIHKALELPPEQLESIAKSSEGYTFLHELANYTRDRKVLRDELVAVLLAGRDTTANTLSWLFYELSKHPDVVEKLSKEILNIVGWDREPTYADLKSMRYLQHTLNETLRLYPV